MLNFLRILNLTEEIQTLRHHILELRGVRLFFQNTTDFWCTSNRWGTSLSRYLAGPHNFHGRRPNCDLRDNLREKLLLQAATKTS